MWRALFWDDISSEIEISAWRFDWITSLWKGWNNRMQIAQGFCCCWAVCLHIAYCLSKLCNPSTTLSLTCELVHLPVTNRLLHRYLFCFTDEKQTKLSSEKVTKCLQNAFLEKDNNKLAWLHVGSDALARVVSCFTLKKLPMAHPPSVTCNKNYLEHEVN